MKMAQEESKVNTEELTKKLENCEKLKSEYLSGWQRERADFLNYKKEEMERINGILEYSEQAFLLKLLPILDNFDIAEKNLLEEQKNDERIQGLLMIKKQILDMLKNQGIETIECIGKKFDPNFHEVFKEVDKEGVEPGIIIEEIQKGYTLKKRLLRAAKVKITK